jgi:hypothetical protein
MNKIKLPTMLAALAITLGLTAAGAGVIHAASGSDSNNPMSNLVNAIATKFNLNTSDVQQVFDEQHAQMEAQKQQNFKDRLAQAVTDGKLTQAQADLIIAKQQELQAQREANKTSMQNMTQAERHATMQAQMTALKQWVADNNIPQQFMFFGGFGKGPGGHGMRGFGIKLNQSTDTSSSQTN